MKNLYTLIILLILIVLPCEADIAGKTNISDSVAVDSTASKARKVSLAAKSANQDDPYSVQMPTFPYKSPEAAAFERYGQYQANEYTGVPDISIPLYELKDRDIDIPITLTYDASGIKVDQEATWVGLGWNLNVGGCITLVPAGQVDKYGRTGLWEDYEKYYDVKQSWMKSSNFKTYNDSDYFDFENGYVPKKYDRDATRYLPQDLCNGLGERDFFSVNVMGKHFMFFFNPYTCRFEIIGKVSEKYTVKALGVEEFGTNAPRHEQSFYDYKQGFIIKDSEGNSYEFRNRENSRIGGITYPSAWNLTSITTQKGSRVVFNYSENHDLGLTGKLNEEYRFISMRNYAEDSAIGYGHEALQTGHFKTYGGQVYAVEKSYLKSIESDNITVSFQHDSERADMTGAVRLNSIAVYSNTDNRLLDSWKFNYSYFKGCNRGGDYTQMSTKLEDFTKISTKLSYRLRLDSITERPDVNGGLVTSFTYDNTQLPLKSSFSTDFWGYYNGKENLNSNSWITGYRTSIPDGPLMYLCGNTITTLDIVNNFKGADRFCDKDYVSAAILTGINCPTKGHTVFTYEPNQFGLDITQHQIYPEHHELLNYCTSAVIASYNTDKTFHSSGARVDDSNVDNQYMPQTRVLLVKLSKSGRYSLNMYFRGNKGKNLRTLNFDGAEVSLISHQTGKNYSYTPDNAVNTGSELDEKTEISKVVKLHLQAGEYTLIANLPDSYGKNSDCIVSAWLTASFRYEDIDADKDRAWNCSTGGGLRIKSITNYASKHGQPVSKTVYDYDGGQLLIPMQFYEYWHKCEYHPVCEYKDHAGYTVSNSSLAFANAFVSSMCPGTVGYSKVTKHEYDGSGNLIKSIVSTYSNNPAANKLRNFYQFDNFDNGELLSTVVFNGNDTLRKVVNAYKHEKIPFTCNIQLTDRSINDCCSEQHGSLITQSVWVGGPDDCRYVSITNRYYSVVYSYYRIWNRLIKSSTIDYTANGNVTTTHEYTYNPKNYMIATDKFGSSEKGKSFVNSYKYPCDYAGNGNLLFVEMTNKNILSPVVDKTLSCNGKELKHIRTVYGSSADSYGIMRYYPTTLQNSLNGTPLETRLTYSDYDEFFNPRTFVMDNTNKITWLYSYVGRYPIMEIYGLTYGEVANIAGTSLVGYLSEKENPQTYRIEAIRNKLNQSGKTFSMSGWLFLPGVGIKETFAPNGNKNTFSYDAMNRLSAVYDYDGRLVSKYGYQYTAGNNHIKAECMLSGDGSKKITEFRYFDGLGRPFETTSNGVGGGGRGVSTYQEYAGLERTGRQWLPVICDDQAEPTTAKDIASLSSKTYHDSHAYSVNTYDALDRITRTTTPGDVCNSADKAVTKEYITNTTNSVRLYTAPMDGENHLVKSGYYDQCTLFGEKTTDEDGHSLTVFTDKLGRKVLERRASNYGYNDTYYVYNDLGQLRFVLSPEYQNAGKKAIYAYEYRYDNRGNIVKKILPQCEYIQYWYDKADRMTFMQDGRMRQQGLYRFYLYDNLSRVVAEGTCSGGNRGKTVRNAVFNASASGLLGTGYTVDNSLNLTSPKLETVNYYDDYGYLNLPLFKDNAALKKTAAPSSPVCAQGLATGSINATNRGELLLTSLYYDVKGEVTEMRRTLPGDALLMAKNTYTFTGNIANTEEMLYKNGKTYKAATANTYNANNDKIASASLSLDGNASHKINTVSYDDLGRISEAIHGAASGVDYAYNLRGWITDITARNFEEHLTYNTGSYGTPCYNGNISTQTWKTADDNILRGYMFTYDKLNRLVNSVYGEGPSFSEHVNRYSESIPQYTANGAIKKIIRHGLKQNGEYGKIDNLDISLNGNQLSRVDDDALPVLRKGATDFYDNKVKTTGAEYEYDENGALIMDANRGITRIEYDMLDNPTLIQFSDGSQTEYVYTSAGEKLRTIHRTATPNITIAMGEKKDLTKEEILEADSTDYIGNFIFENGKPSRYLFGGGYYTYAAPKAGYSNYHYFLTDHLGNNRVVENENDSIEQVTHYYPFGGVYADAGLNANMQKYKYNGKELDQMHGLNSYDYGARQYYPTVPIWDRMDPLSEKYYHLSPYSYCGGDPINRVDLHGDSITILDMASIDAIYNALQPGTNLSIKFNNGVLIPESIRQIALNSPDAFLQDLYTIATNPQMVELATTSTNDYYIGNQFFSNPWSSPSDIDYAKEFNNGQESLLYPLGKTIIGNLGQTLYPISSDEYKRSTNNNVRININAMGNINQRSCGIAHEFGHVILFLKGQPHSHSNNADYIYGRQWNVMRRLGYDYLESPTGTVFR